MLYTNPEALAQMALMAEPKIDSIMIEVDGMQTRLAVERGGQVTVRGERLQWRETIPWGRSEYRDRNPKTVVQALKRKIKRVIVSMFEDDEEERESMRLIEYPSWSAFVRWVGKPSDNLDKISWQECPPLNVHIPPALNTALEDTSTVSGESKRQIVVRALERYLDSAS